VFENSAEKREYLDLREKITEQSRKCYINELHRLFFSPNINKVIKSRGMTFVEHTTSMGVKRKANSLYL
jgi:hypothetical protein